MGNCIRERKPALTQFDQQDIQRMEDTFNYYCDLQTNTRKRKMLCQQNFEEIFIENPEFGRKLFRLLEVYGGREKYISKGVLFSILEVFLKDSCSTQELKNFEKLELMTLVSLKQTGFIYDREELSKLKITYLDAMVIVNDLLRMRLSGTEQQVDERVTKALLDSVFQAESGLMEWYELVRVMRHRLKGAQQMIKLYFLNKFMRKSFPTIIPTLNNHSYLLNEDSLFILQLSCQKTVLRGALKLNLIYSSIVHQGGFDQMAQAILDARSPTLTIFQHEEKYNSLYDKSFIYKTNVFGAISNQRWFDTALAQGDVRDCLFQLYPSFQVFNPQPQRAAKKNYCYMNTKDRSRPIGIGFGYDEGQCRIWFDKNIKSSYCKAEDLSYEPEIQMQDLLIYQFQKQIKQKINLVEVWAIEHPEPEQEPEFYTPNAMPIQIIEEPIQVADSKADFYWMGAKKQEKKVEEPTADFYWAKDQDRKKNLSKTQEPFIPSLIQTTYVEEREEKFIDYEEQKVVASTIRRSNVQRPIIDGNDKTRKIEAPSPIYQQVNQERIVKSSYESNTKQRKTVDDIIRDYEQRQSQGKVKRL